MLPSQGCMDAVTYAGNGQDFDSHSSECSSCPDNTVCKRCKQHRWQSCKGLSWQGYSPIGGAELSQVILAIKANKKIVSACAYIQAKQRF